MASVITHAITIRPATPDDLPAVNQVIEAAVMTWQLPERVKRLSLPSYRYDALDLDHLETVVAVTHSGRIVGVAAWEEAEPQDCPAGKTALLLHGLYVSPEEQRGGIGSRLLAAAEEAARIAGTDGLLVKAQNDAVAFFLAHGLERFPALDPARHYANRLWKPLP